MHGTPPKVFPRREIGEYFSLHILMENSLQRMDDLQRQKDALLNEQVRSYPRTAANDPFYFNSQEMAQQLATETGLETLFCFNELCNPSLIDVVDTAVENGAQRIIVLTPMMTRDGDHAEEEIPADLETLRKAHPAVEFQYAWPFDPDRVPVFWQISAEQNFRLVSKFIGGSERKGQPVLYRPKTKYNPPANMFPPPSVQSGALSPFTVSPPSPTRRL